MRFAFVLAFGLLAACSASLPPDEAYQRAGAAASRGDQGAADAYYRQAAESGHPRAAWALAGLPIYALEQPGGALLYRIPLDDIDEARIVEANAALQEQAESDAQAQYALGLAAWNGWGMERDTVAAHAWMERAASADHLNALLWIGQWGVLYDPASSADPLRRAVDAAALLDLDASQRVLRQAYAALSNAVMAHHFAEGDTVRAFTDGYAVLREASEATGDAFWLNQRDRLLSDLSAGVAAGSPTAEAAARELGVSLGDS